TNLLWYTQNAVTIDRVSSDAGGANMLNDQMGVLTLQVTSDSPMPSTPEPATFGLMAGAFLGIAILTRRRTARR
ncbi:MAG: PEP-CTERM sorting domain-containing protein, partial [Acidobacteriota bacterium]|nr:PEP-CTERM sorting domain-containing protein [Acidobacteriota bacterium]